MTIHKDTKFNLWAKGYNAYSEITSIKQELTDKKTKEENEKKEEEKLLGEEKKEGNEGTTETTNTDQNAVKKASGDLTEVAIAMFDERNRERIKQQLAERKKNEEEELRIKKEKEEEMK